MPSEDASPSVGWREMCGAMGTDPDPDPDGGDGLRADGRGDGPLPEPCPDCGAIPGVDAGDLCCDHRGGAGGGTEADSD